MQRYLGSRKKASSPTTTSSTARPSDYAFITSLYPLWAGVATREEANKIEAQLNLFERPGGLIHEQHQHRPAMG